MTTTTELITDLAKDELLVAWAGNKTAIIISGVHTAEQAAAALEVLAEAHHRSTERHQQ